MAVSRGKNGTRQVHDPQTGRIVTNLAGDSAQPSVVSKPPTRPKQTPAVQPSPARGAGIEKASKRIIARQEKLRQVEERFERLDDIDTKMKSYRKEYDRSAARDLMSKKNVSNVLAELDTDGKLDFYSEYDAEDADNILTEIVIKEGRKSSDVLDSFVTDKNNAFEYLLQNGYIKSLDSLKEECWDLMQEDGVEAVRARLAEEAEKCPAVAAVWKEFDELDMANGNNYGYSSWDD